MSAAESAEIVIIGGGAVGCGVAYQLALAGKRDILLLEKESSVAAATSSQAAGLVGQVRSTVERIKLAQWSVATFSQMQQ
ncbi:MAG: FAD-dependent oxidoreductase, partial [Pirellulales bacterium]|nr:FAD-dependent oxidoreductase [Pirellulales bacterium]